jgi:hypothetical protein
VQKLLYAILITKCKLLHYFESHLACVVISHGLREIIGNCLTTGRIVEWDLELMGLDITHVPQMAIKSQVLAVFVAEWTDTTTAYPGDLGALDHVLQRLLHPQWGGGRHRSDFPQGGLTPLCDLAIFPCDKQRGKI